MFSNVCVPACTGDKQVTAPIVDSEHLKPSPAAKAHAPPPSRSAATPDPKQAAAPKPASVGQHVMSSQADDGHWGLMHEVTAASKSGMPSMQPEHNSTIQTAHNAAYGISAPPAIYDPHVTATNQHAVITSAPPGLTPIRTAAAQDGNIPYNSPLAPNMAAAAAVKGGKPEQQAVAPPRQGSAQPNLAAAAAIRGADTAGQTQGLRHGAGSTMQWPAADAYGITAEQVQAARQASPGRGFAVSQTSTGQPQVGAPLNQGSVTGQQHVQLLPTQLRHPSPSAIHAQQQQQQQLNHQAASPQQASKQQQQSAQQQPPQQLSLAQRRQQHPQPLTDINQGGQQTAAATCNQAGLVSTQGPPAHSHLHADVSSPPPSMLLQSVKGLTPPALAAASPAASRRYQDTDQSLEGLPPGVQSAAAAQQVQSKQEQQQQV